MSDLMTINQNTAAIIKAEIDMQIATAKMYPREVKKSLDKAIAMVTMDQETAESCIYAKPRKNDKGENDFIKGESVRLAEIAAIAWGNIHYGTRIVGNDGKKITARGIAWDLESNVKADQEVDRSIWSTRYNKSFSEDMQVVTGNAAAAIAKRNVIISIIGKSYIRRIYNEAVKAAIGDQSQLSKKVNALFDRFKKMGIQPEKILAYFDKKSVDQITVDEVEEMIGIGTAIKDRSLSIDQAFEIETVRNANKTVKLNEELKVSNTTPDPADPFVKELREVE
jgi:phage anti-repressor protein